MEECRLEFEKPLAESVQSYGHLCPGQVLGVKMSLRGLRDRHSGPKVQTAERFPCHRGNGPLRAQRGAVRDRLQPRPKNAKAHGLRQNGNDLCGPENGAVRSRERAKGYSLDIDDVYAAQCEAYKVMSDVELFEVTNVEVLLRAEDMQDRPLRRIRCDICGELVQDMRGIYRGRQVLCKPCANGGYYFTK